ncbi:RNA polymerase sigma factor [Streptococcus porcinus]|uniref:RNA polymerase sigma factor n=1 Tax=Streptococcus porcinus TaxID=1340 RepID=UPI0010CAD08C|nr:sigma-70 family RNA polymerase sigma factor [Streptococcus porcinus]VTS26366.1 RNA polymerase sigma factor [Streptococcus porcinus]
MQDDYKKVYEQYFKDVYLYILSICKNESLAEEITQEAFFKALKNYKSFKGECKVYSWLCQIAKNTFYNHCKKERKNVYLDDYEQIDFTTDIEKNFEDAEETMRAHLLLHKLNEPYKEVFSLRVFADLSFKQIGEIFGKTDSWARVTFYRAKNRLLEEMK